jgi:hypothetical protein
MKGWVGMAMVESKLDENGSEYDTLECDASTDSSPHGFVYEIQKVLIGDQAARVLFIFRAEAKRNRDQSQRQIDLPSHEAWVVTTDFWPVDGSWKPTPSAIEVLSSEPFRLAVEELGESLESHPITGHDSFRHSGVKS